MLCKAHYNVLLSRHWSGLSSDPEECGLNDVVGDVEASE